MKRHQLNIAWGAAIILFTAAITLFSLGIWFNDARFGGIGGIAACATIVMVAVGAMIHESR